MILNFVDQTTEDIFHGRFGTKSARGVPQTLHRRASLLLQVMDSTARLDDLRVPPGNRLKELEGDRAGTWSVRINDQWRITFKFQSGEFKDVLIEDYH
jgi:proteic killer suppression protein